MYRARSMVRRSALRQLARCAPPPILDRAPRSLGDLLRRPQIRPVSWEPVLPLRRVDTLVVMPVGPGWPTESADTLRSILQHTCERSRCVVVVDDHTTDGTAEEIAQVADDTCVLLRTDRPNGITYLKRSLAQAFTWCLDQLQFDILLRIDTDALLLAPGLIEDGRQHHLLDSTHGCFGRFDREPDGSRRSFEGLAAHIAKHERRIGKPYYAPLRDAARRNGWSDGAHVFGAACFYTRDCLMALRRLGALDIPDHSPYQHLSEDLYYSMAVVAAGYELGHFAAPDGPMALAWRELPFEPQEHVRRGDKVVHSVDKGVRAQGARARFRELT